MVKIKMERVRLRRFNLETIHISLKIQNKLALLFENVPLYMVQLFPYGQV